ncbi:thermonuclease family protein [Stutzerimonas stutzeri]|uniref:thermonuclease family protein n=1 Tax=Stutzerimonas stutzeri TaxID=316 RepID=UPI0021FDCB2A|nr:thermonuclease family protein [Stutzerimonas stutzeri]UVO18547.1 thermonuclease family protein [Stutzerimonas stutzeri]
MQFSEYMKKASLVGAFFVSVVCSLSVQAFCPAPERLPQVAVAQVIDGDTLRLTDGRSVRLIGLNTPELGRKGRVAEPLADAARNHLQQLVKASDGRLGLRMGREARDRYGRVLAHAYDVQGNNLEAALLAQGLGFFVAVAPNTELVDCHRAAEAQARQQHRGLWKRPPLRHAREIRAGGFALVEGRVERVERNRGGLWIELDGPLVLHVPLRDVAAFAALQASLRGARIEARGWVVDRGSRTRRDQARWLMRLSHPAALDVRR